MRWRLKNDTRAKYGADRTTCRAGQPHASRTEAARCDELHLLQTSGAIRELRAHPQVRYPLVVAGVQICTYVADFCYVEAGSAQAVVEDTKGFRTREYQIKRRLMRACLGIEVREARPRSSRQRRVRA